MVPFKVDGLGGAGPPSMTRGPLMIRYGHGPGPPHRSHPPGRHGNGVGGGSGGVETTLSTSVGRMSSQQHLGRALSLGAPTQHRSAYRTTRGYHQGNGPFLAPSVHLQVTSNSGGGGGGGGGGGYLTTLVPQQQLQQKKQLSAKELTGAPLISYVPRNRKVKKKTSDSGASSASVVRSRHCSQPNYYLGQNLYRNIQIQDFYHNPIYAMQSTPVFTSHHNHTSLRESMCTSCDTLSDSYSLSSDDFDNFLPRIIRPRRRRKKEKKEKKKRKEVRNVKDLERDGVKDDKDETESCLGSEKQWLPQGLLSAESSYDSRSESGSSVEDAPVHRKLGPALSMPAYHTFAQSTVHLVQDDSVTVGETLTAGVDNATSDYSSLNSNSSDTLPSSSTDHLCDSDSSRSDSEQSETTRLKNGVSSTNTNSESGQKSPLKLVKSTSSSFFRSPKMASKLEVRDERTKRLLRKTNSWNPAPKQEEFRASFSLFSPAGSIDLLSGIRKNLRKLDLNCEDE